MPLAEVSGGGGGFAIFDDTTTMNFSYGSGNWLRCTMTATDWAYISDDICAHQAPAGYSQPQSLLTTNFDYGPYSPAAGTPFFRFQTAPASRTTARHSSTATRRRSFKNGGSCARAAFGPATCGMRAARLLASPPTSAVGC